MGGKNFFIHGELAMRPLVLREIADNWACMESTISRVTTAKYMATPMGTFELKYFFGSGLDAERGLRLQHSGACADPPVCCCGEPQKPLSDSQLERLLKRRHRLCAGTVAKYREPAHRADTLRRAL